MMTNRPTLKVLPAFGETEIACTMQQSTTFVKKLVTVAMSTIMYMRGIFPEHCFGDRMVGGKPSFSETFMDRRTDKLRI
jgi:hypothetical protein